MEIAGTPGYMAPEQLEGREATTRTDVYALRGWLLANAPADHFAPSAVDVAVFAVVQTGIVLLAVRFGLLTVLVASFVSLLLTFVPIAIDSAVPYAQASWLIAAAVIALAVYGWHTALAGQPMLNVLFPRDEPGRTSRSRS